MTEVERTVASDRDLQQLGDDVVAAVLEKVAEATRDADAHRATPCEVTVDVEAVVVDDADPAFEETDGVLRGTSGP